MTSNNIHRTIGGFIQMDELVGTEYHLTPLRFNLCRNAFITLVSERRYKHIYVPFLMCSCITDALDHHNIRYSYYHIDEKFKPIIDFEVSDTEAVIIINYLGTLSAEEITGYVNQYKNVIIDNTQAFYSVPENSCGEYLYSCRKWFGVPDGAYLYTVGEIKEYAELQIDRSSKRMGHIWGKYEDTEGDYYSEYSAIEHLLDSVEPMQMSQLTKNLLRAIDYDLCAKKRETNYTVLSQIMDNYNGIQITPKTVPFMYPFYTEKADYIRNKLKENRCFTPTLWPNVLTFNQEMLEYQYAANIVYIPCDQRYTATDMEWIACLLKKYL